MCLTMPKFVAIGQTVAEICQLNGFPNGGHPHVLYFQQVAQLSQRDRATHELLRFAKLRSGIFETPFWGLRGNVVVDASCVRRLKKRGRLPIGDNWTLASTHSFGIAKWRF